MSPAEFLGACMQLSFRFGYRVTSGFRSVAANLAVGGAVESAHQYWVGCDVVLDRPTDKHAFCLAAARVGLRALDEGDHIHLQPAGWAK